MTKHNPWLPRYVPSPHARLKLFCLPNAGGGPTSYRPWLTAFPSTIQVLPVHLPGRETRIAEPLHRSFQPLVETLLAGLHPFLDGPFALFGHSMGALLSFELTRTLRRHGLPLPKVLFTSAFRAPQIPRDRHPLHGLEEKEFRAALKRYNGTPQSVLDHPEMMDLFGPILRADFELCETYQYEPEPPLDIPVIALGGSNDGEVPVPHVEAWREQSSRFAVHILPGDHFYVVPQRAAVVGIIVSALTPFLAE